MSKARTLAGVVSTGSILADGTINAAEIGSLTLPTGGDIVGTTSAQTIAGKTIAFADNTLTGVQAALTSGTNIKTINSGSLLGSGNINVGDVTLDGTQTLTNKTLQASNITGALSLSGAAGTAGQVLTTQGAGNAPTWTSSGVSYASLLKFA